MRFEWDENKDRINRAKHGIDFRLASKAFGDPFAIARQDRDVDGEQRYQLVGAVSEAILLVAYVAIAEPETEDPVIRIISARKATPSERRLYEEGITN